MIKTIIAVISGYITLAVLTFFTFACIDWAFPSALPEPDGYPSLTWAFLILSFSFCYAFIAGYVTAWLSDSHLGALLSLTAILMGLAILSVFLSPTTIHQPLPYGFAIIGVNTAAPLLGGLLRKIVTHTVWNK